MPLNENFGIFSKKKGTTDLRRFQEGKMFKVASQPFQDLHSVAQLPEVTNNFWGLMRQKNELEIYIENRQGL